MPRQKFFDTEAKPERAVLVGIITPGETEEQTHEYLDELKFLVETAGGETQKAFTQRMQRPDRATFVGTGNSKRSMPMLSRKRLIWSFLMMNFHLHNSGILKMNCR
jgi:hypothetical protein